MKKFILYVLLSVSLFSCNSAATGGAENTVVAEESAEQKATVADQNQTEIGGLKDKMEATDRMDESLMPAPAPNRVEKIATKIIKTANLQFQVRDVDKSHEQINELVKKYGAYFASDNKTMSSYQIDDNLVIRVTPENFDALVAELMKQSIYTNSKSITAEDVTSQFVDMQARLKTKKEVEQRYLALLKEAHKVSDILEVEQQLGQIREEIEAMEGQLKLLTDQVNYSTISLNIYQKLDYTPEPESGFFSEVNEAFIRGWRGIGEFLVGLVRVWPLLIVICIAAVLVIRRIRARRKQA